MRETHGEKIASIRSGFAKHEKRTTCRDCEIVLTEENQYASCRKRGQYCCKKCWNQRFYFAVKKGKYGISLGNLAELLRLQDYKCRVCEKHLSQKEACVDHCHDDGRVRGILCNGCNSGIGMLQDSLEIVERAVTYLQETCDVDWRSNFQRSNHVRQEKEIQAGEGSVEADKPE
jgi:hypothetical protein